MHRFGPFFAGVSSPRGVQPRPSDPTVSVVGAPASLSGPPQTIESTAFRRNVLGSSARVPRETDGCNWFEYTGRHWQRLFISFLLRILCPFRNSRTLLARRSQTLPIDAVCARRWWTKNSRSVKSIDRTEGNDDFGRLSRPEPEEGGLDRAEGEGVREDLGD